MRVQARTCLGLFLLTLALLLCFPIVIAQECTDSDGGVNENVYGSTEGISPSTNERYSGSDVCGTGTVYPLGSLVEHYCDGIYHTNTLVSCPNGCGNGACIPSLSKCVLQPGLSCVDYKIEPNVVQVVIRNGYGSDLSINEIRVQNCGKLIPETNFFQNGQQQVYSVSCVTPLQKTTYSGILNISYTNLDSGLTRYNIGDLVGPVESKSVNTCTDSDGGMRIASPGIATGTDPSNPEITNYHYKDNCNKNYPNLLYESYCDGDFVVTTAINCSGGCLEGACIPTPDCVESDNGLDYYSKGFATGYYAPATEGYGSGELYGSFGDYCLATYSSPKVVEHSCGVNSGGKKVVNVNWYDCPNGCYEGSCRATNECNIDDPHNPCNSFDLSQYPYMFFENGKFNGIIVVGDSAPAEHVIAASQLAQSLQEYQDSINSPNGNANEWLVQNVNNHLEMSENLHVGENKETIADVMGGNSINWDLLPELEHVYGSNPNGNFDYYQNLYFDDPSTGYVQYVESDATSRTADHLVFKNGRQIARYVMNFSTSLQSDLGQMTSTDRYALENLEDVELGIVGKTYIITSAYLTTTNTIGMGLTLMSGAVRDTMLEGVTKTYNIGGKDYEVTLTYTDSDEAQFQVNGETTMKLKDGSTDKLSDGMNIGVSEILYQDYAGGIHSATFFLCAEKIELNDINIMDTAPSGTLTANGERIDGIKIGIQGELSGVARIHKIEVIMNADDGYYVPSWNKLSENPDFDQPDLLFTRNWDIEYRGLSYDPLFRPDEFGVVHKGFEDGRINESQFDFAFPDSTEEFVWLPFVSLTPSGTLKYGDQDNDFILSENSPISTDDYFIVSDSSSLRGERPTYALQYLGSDALTDDNPAMLFKLLGTNELINLLFFVENNAVPGPDGALWVEISSLKLGGKNYKVYAKNTNADDFDIIIDLNNDGAVLASSSTTITTHAGAEIALSRGNNSVSLTLHTPDDAFDDHAANKVESLQPTDATFVIAPQDGKLVLKPSDHLNHRLVSAEGNENLFTATTSFGAQIYYSPNFEGAGSAFIVNDYPHIQRFPKVYITTKSKTSDIAPIQVKLASEVYDFGGNIISIGSYCTNQWTPSVPGSESCHNGVSQNTGRIRLDTYDGRIRLAVEGYDDKSDVLTAANALANYDQNYMQGKEFTIQSQPSRCFDSDYGTDVYTAGFGYDGEAYREERPLQDSCINAHMLEEATCQNDMLTTHQIWCRGGCTLGVCQPYVQTSYLATDKKVYSLGEDIIISASIESNAKNEKDTKHFGAIQAKVSSNYAEYPEKEITLNPTSCKTEKEWDGYVKRCIYNATLKNPERGTYSFSLLQYPLEAPSKQNGYYGSTAVVMPSWPDRNFLALGEDIQGQTQNDLNHYQYRYQFSGQQPQNVPVYTVGYNKNNHQEYTYLDVYVFDTPQDASNFIAYQYDPQYLGPDATITKQTINGNVVNVVEYRDTYTDEYGGQRLRFYSYLFWTTGRVLFLFKNPEIDNDVLAYYLGRHPSDAEGSVGAKSYRLTLGKGWNLISSPVFSYGNGQKFNTFNHTCSFAQSFMWTWEGEMYKKKEFLAPPQSTAFWVKTNNDCRIDIQGDGSFSKVSWQSGQLAHGWNMIGAPVQPVSIDEVKGSCSIHRGPYWYNSKKNAYEQVSTLEPGKGYLVMMLDSCQLYYSQPSGEQPPGSWDIPSTENTS